MSDSDMDILAGVLLDEDAVVSLTEICITCGVTAERVTEMVEYGILEPGNEGSGQWEFRAISLRRVTTVVRLQRDLGVNLAGAALALDLLDELRELRARSD